MPNLTQAPFNPEQLVFFSVSVFNVCIISQFMYSCCQTKVWMWNKTEILLSKPTWKNPWFFPFSIIFFIDINILSRVPWQSPSPVTCSCNVQLSRSGNIHHITTYTSMFYISYIHWFCLTDGFDSKSLQSILQYLLPISILCLYLKQKHWSISEMINLISRNPATSLQSLNRCVRSSYIAYQEKSLPIFQMMHCFKLLNINPIFVALNGMFFRSCNSECQR